MGSKWLSWEEVNAILKTKELFFYGRSDDWIPKAFKKLIKKPKVIIDSNPDFSGTLYEDIPVESKEYLLEQNLEEIFIVITTANYHGVESFLSHSGLIAGVNFACCPEYRSFSLREEIVNYKQEVIVCSSDYNDQSKARSSITGGGIYKYHIGPNESERVAEGSFRQITQAKELFYAVDHVDRRVCVFDRSFNILETFYSDSPKNCGITFNEKRNLIIISNPEYDTISIHDASSFEKLECIPYSVRIEGNLTSQHHINDICCTDDHLYISYFSHSGNWKKGVYDGGISEINLEKLSAPPVRVVQNLWQPHSPEIINGELCYLDSMRGRLHTTTHIIAGEFPGFARGLAYDGRFYYVGQTENMYISRLIGERKNIMINAGFYLFDIKTKASRFFPMFGNMNVHDLLIEVD